VPVISKTSVRTLDWNLRRPARQKQNRRGRGWEISELREKRGNGCLKTDIRRHATLFEYQEDCIEMASGTREGYIIQPHHPTNVQTRQGKTADVEQNIDEVDCSHWSRV